MDQLGKVLVAGAFWTTLDRWGARFLRLGVLAVLARLLKPEDFGLVAAAAVCVDYLSTYIGQGLGLAVIQRRDLEDGHLDAMFYMNMAFAVVLTLLLWVLAPWISEWIGAPEAASVLRWLSSGLVLQALSRVHMAVLTREMRFRALAGLNLLSAGLGGVTAVTLALLGWGVWSLVAQMLVTAAVARLLVWWVLDWRPGLRCEGRHLRDLYSFSLFVFADQQLLFLSRRLDEALVAGYLGIAELGYYSVAKRLVLVLQDLLETPLSQVLFPAFSRIQDAATLMLEEAARILRASSLLAMPAFLGLLALAPQVLEIVFGAQWVSAADSVRLLSLGGLPFLVGLVLSPILLATGRPGILLALNGAAAVVGAGLLLVAIPYGAVGVATAVSLRQFILAGVSLLLVSRLFRAGGLLGTILRSWLGGCVTGFSGAVVGWLVANYLIVAPIWLSLGTATAAGALAAAVSAYAFEPELSREFRRLLAAHVPRWISRQVG